MEFLRVCAKVHFDDVVISIKASNTVVMVQSVRLLVDAMRREKMDFPLHLGVTEAGEGEDGRIKSAVGIGALLSDGIGDTIRVSLSEPPEAEIPVAYKLASYVIGTRSGHNHIPGVRCLEFDWLHPPRRATCAAGNIGGKHRPCRTRHAPGLHLLWRELARRLATSHQCGHRGCAGLAGRRRYLSGFLTTISDVCGRQPRSGQVPVPLLCATQ